MARPQLRSNRFLPEFVSRFKARNGTYRYRFRRTGYQGGYFKHPFGTAEFGAEYHAFMNPATAVKAKKLEREVASGTIDHLLARYYDVPARLGPSMVTQQKVRAVLEDFRAGRGDRPVALVTFEVIEKIVAKKVIKTGTGNRTKGGIHAAQKLRKELIRLFDFAVKTKFIAHNPAANSAKVKIPISKRTGGFHSWAEEEIAQFRACHKLGTRERLAMELLLWTDQRRCDVVNMGPGTIKNGRIPVTQEKTGKELWLPVAPALVEAIVAMESSTAGASCFLVTKFGKPFKTASFGNFFKDACKAAGLDHCSAHGLRKATLRRMADLQMAHETMKAISGHTDDRTLAIYLDKANQKMLADTGIATLAAWEKSMLESGDTCRPIQSPNP